MYVVYSSLVSKDMITTAYNHLLFFVYSMILPAAACSLGLNVGQDCRVEDKDAGYVFDLTPLAKKTWGQKDFVTAVNNINSQYKYRLKVRLTPNLAFICNLWSFVSYLQSFHDQEICNNIIIIFISTA